LIASLAGLPICPSQRRAKFKITLRNEQSDLPISAASVAASARHELAARDLPSCELVVHLVSEKRICQLHADHFDDPTSTDCITFPIDDIKAPPPGGLPILGEVFLCPAVAVSYCNEHGGDPYRECTLYLLHTILHLLGFRDDEDEAERAMREEERLALKRAELAGSMIKRGRAPIRLSF